MANVRLCVHMLQIVPALIRECPENITIGGGQLRAFRQ